MQERPFLALFLSLSGSHQIRTGGSLPFSAFTHLCINNLNDLNG